MKSAIVKIAVSVITLLFLTHAATGVLAAPAEAEKSASAKPAAFPIVRPTLLPDGVADEDGKFSYLRNVEGGIDAVEIASGKTRWTTKITAKPLELLSGNLIVQVPVKGQANALKIAVLDAVSGKQILLSDALVFPNWVVVATEDSAVSGKWFNANLVVQKDELSFNWEARSFYAGGAAPPPEVIAEAFQNSGAYSKVNLKTGHVNLGNLRTYIGMTSNPIDIRPFAEKIPKGSLNSLDWKYALVTIAPQNEDSGEQKRTIINMWDGNKLGEMALGDKPEDIAVIGTKIFWVTSTPPAGGRIKPGEWVTNTQLEGGRVKLQTIERELTVAEIATGKILWQRALKPGQIVPLPM